MGLAQFNGVVLLQFDDITTGNFQAGAPVTVRNATTNQLAPIFSDDLSTPMVNPMIAGNEGQFTFWVESGNYNLIVNENTPEQENLLNVPIVDPLTSAPVQSVFNRQGNIIAVAGDYDALKIDYDNALTPNWPVDNVQTALQQAYNDIEFLAGSVVLRGVWDATLNTPDLLTINKISGNYWIVSVGGSTVLPLYPGAPAFLLPYEVNDKILWLDDGVGITGFAQLRADSSEFLLLTGGTMLGDITLSNALSVNTVTANADAGNIGKNSLAVTPIATYDIAGFFAADGSTSAYVNIVSNSPNFRFALGIDFSLSNELKYITTNSGVANTNNLFYSDTRTSAQANALLDEVETGFLPLTGGTLTGDGSLLIIKPLNAGSNAPVWFTSFDDIKIGDMGKVDHTVDDIALRASTTKLRLESQLSDINVNAINGVINLTAPTTNVSGNALSIRDCVTASSSASAALNMQSSKTDPASISYLRTFKNYSGGTIWWERITASALEINTGGSGDGAAMLRLTTASTLQIQGDVTAFAGLPNEVSMSELQTAVVTTGTTATGGWVKQGNYYREWGTTAPQAGDSAQTITLTNAFANTTYTINTSIDYTGQGFAIEEPCGYQAKTATNFQTVATWGGGVSMPIAWSVQGFV